MNSSSKINLIIADDHKMFLSGMAHQLLERFNVLATADTAPLLFEHLNTYTADILLLDIDFGIHDGVNLCSKIITEYPEIKVIALTMHDEGSYIRNMIEAGAQGYLLKESPLDEVIKAIETVYDGKTFFSSKASANMMESMVMSTPKHHIRLSRREKEVLSLILKEHTSDEIAEILFLSKHTVETHRANLIGKMNVRNVAGLVKKTLELKILEGE